MPESATQGRSKRSASNSDWEVKSLKILSQWVVGPIGFVLSSSNKIVGTGVESSPFNIL